MATLTTRVTALESDVADIKAGVTAILATLQAQEPAKPAKAQPKADAEPNEFVQWLRETAPQRAARKSSNREMADWLRSKGLPTNGAVWEACKKGERSVKALRKLA